MDIIKITLFIIMVISLITAFSFTINGDPYRKHHDKIIRDISGLAAIGIALLFCVNANLTKNKANAHISVTSQRTHKPVHQHTLKTTPPAIQKVVKKETNDQAKIQSNSKNINIIVQDTDYGNANSDSETVLEVVHGLQRFNLKGLKNIKIILQAPVNNKYGRSIGYKPVDWYNFKTNDINKMNTSNMDVHDLGNVATNNGSKDVQSFK